MMRRIFCVWIFLLFCIVHSSSTFASSQEVEEAGKRIQDDIEISLITFSPHNDLFAWFGHSALEVKNTRTGHAVHYNFGGFFFDYEHFIQFAMGKFIFWSFTQDAERHLIPYQRENRHIVFQTLALNSQQKEEIQRLLAFYLQSENRFYRYDHFLDNCSTKIRDIIDQALDGALKRQSSELADLTFRQYVHRMTYQNPVLNFVTLFLLNDHLDKSIQNWDSMFLPDRLMIEVQKATNPYLKADSKVALVKKRLDQNVGQGTPFYKEKAENPDTRIRELTYGMILLVLVGLSAILYKKGNILKKMYPFLVSIYGLIFGSLGLVLFTMMSFTEHKDTYWNENILLLNPVTLMLFPLGIVKMFGKGQYYFSMVSVLVGLGGISALIVKIFPIFDQLNGQQLRVLLPSLVLIGILGITELRKSKSEPLLKSNNYKP